ERGARLQSASWRLADRRGERQGHGAEQAGLTTLGDSVRGHGAVEFDRDVDHRVPVLDADGTNAADDDVVDQNGRIRLQRTDIRDLDVVDGRVGPTADRTWQRDGVQAVEGATRHGHRG